jgi:hypothetical protein
MYRVDVHEHGSILPGKRVEVMSVDGVEQRTRYYRRTIEMPGYLHPPTAVE